MKFLTQINLFFIVVAVGVGITNASDQTAFVEPWIIEEKRDEFDDNLLSLSTLVLDSRRNGGWLSFGCDLDDKRFTFNIVSSEYGRRFDNVDDQKDNLKYIIDDGKPKLTTTTQVVHGTSIENDPKSPLIKDILAGGKELKVQFLGNLSTGPVAKFDIEKAPKTINKIIKSCR